MAGERNGIGRESDLYGPVKAYFEQDGWQMKGEVAHCDGLAVREGRVLAVEMKLTLNLDLILQGVERQKMADVVYLAVPRKPKAMATRRWLTLLRLLERQNLGLLIVTRQAGREPVEELLTPGEGRASRPKGMAAVRRRAALREFDARSGDRNTGGVTGEKLMTAYRETALRLAAGIAERGPSTAKELRQPGEECRPLNRLMYLNHYHWFQPAGQGRYDLTDAGRAALGLYALPEPVEDDGFGGVPGQD